jgi:hypothetical protein
VKLHGLFGRPYLDLEPLVDATGLDAIDEEITYGLALATTSYTGGSLKWMGVVAPWAIDDGYLDYGHVIEAMPDDEFRAFVSLAEDPARFDVARRTEYQFGDETDHPLTPAQMRFLEYRHGVYFPWKACYHLLENDKWDDKHSGAGKDFDAEAKRLFPKTIAFIQRLPFREIGRAVVFGVLANDHAPAHRDTEPGRALTVAQSISFDPRRQKRFYLMDPDGTEKTPVDARIYWFNDMDYHGVDPAPAFQYSIRVDGTFEPAFLAKLERTLRR